MVVRERKNDHCVWKVVRKILAMITRGTPSKEDFGSPNVKLFLLNLYFILDLQIVNETVYTALKEGLDGVYWLENNGNFQYWLENNKQNYWLENNKGLKYKE